MGNPGSVRHKRRFTFMSAIYGRYKSLESFTEAAQVLSSKIQKYPEAFLVQVLKHVHHGVQNLKFYWHRLLERIYINTRKQLYMATQELFVCIRLKNIWHNLWPNNWGFPKFTTLLHVVVTDTSKKMLLFSLIG